MRLESEQRGQLCGESCFIGAGYRPLPCEEHASYACDRCGALVCTFHLLLGGVGGAEELCPRCWGSQSLTEPQRSASRTEGDPVMPEPEAPATQTRTPVTTLVTVLGWLFRRRDDEP